ncbi:MAG TPA: hypothetical protein VLA68_01560 [Nitrososphaera sp.]|jgi:hypothetical protein|nr:hypothetical protein [Nitrososphaera sp.]
MESALSATRTIEYPADLSGCSIIGVGDRQLLYLCTKGNGKPFVVVLGFFSGQKEDIITKDLIEPVAEENKRRIADIVASSLFNEYQNAQIFFL